MTRLCGILLCVSVVGVPVVAHAQTTAPSPASLGIVFEDPILTWPQVLAKAQAERKHIFVDVYATWCGPCKTMDKNVYTLEKVGKYFNGKFISLKVQMDITRGDAEQVKKWYAHAALMQQQYAVTALPSFLFFSPSGALVHRGMGSLGADELIMLGEAAIDASKQQIGKVFAPSLEQLAAASEQVKQLSDKTAALAERDQALLEDYRQGKRDYPALGKLAQTVRDLGDGALATAIAEDYKLNYLDTLSEAAFLSKENIQFLYKFQDLIVAEGSRGRFFKFLYGNLGKADEWLGMGNADYYVRYIITKEEIDDKLWRDGQPVTNKPDWQQIESAIEKKYNRQYAKSLVSKAKLVFYRSIEDWRTFAELMDKRIKENPPTRDDAFWLLNDAAWEVFLRCNDKTVLARALAWSDLSIKLRPDAIQELDTRANLLYKLGRTAEAIKQEEAAIAEAKKRDDLGLANEYASLLAKMKKGEPTWPVK